MSPFNLSPSNLSPFNLSPSNLSPSNLIRISALTLSLALAPAAYAGGDAAKGAVKAKEVCAACHADDGNGKKEFPDYPKLAGQNADYLVHSLKAYKAGTRKNAIMGPMAQPLTPQEIEDVSAYFSKQVGSLKVMR